MLCLFSNIKITNEISCVKTYTSKGNWCWKGDEQKCNTYIRVDLQPAYIRLNKYNIMSSSIAMFRVDCCRV